jgi:hypothetical protein
MFFWLGVILAKIMDGYASVQLQTAYVTKQYCAMLAKFGSSSFLLALESFTRWDEILKFLLKQGRIVPDKFTGIVGGGSDSEWLNLAMESHRESALDIIVTRSQASLPPGFCAVEISSIESSRWWMSRSESTQVYSSRRSYMSVLDRIARSSRRLMFVDPYLDVNHREFREVLKEINGINPDISLEMHISDSGGRTRDFSNGFFSHIKWNGRATVHVWRKFHHRYLRVFRSIRGCRRS